MYDIKEEHSLEVFRECLAFGKAQYEEVESKSNVNKFNPDYGMLSLMHQAGITTLVTARKEGELVGYVANVVVPSLFHQKLEAKELAIFVSKEHRGGRLFFKMMKESERILKDKGVNTIYIMFKEGHNKGFAERLGYEETETVYQKILEG